MKKEELDTIENAVNFAKKRVVILETIKECSTLMKYQQYELDQHKHCIERGEPILKKHGRIK